MAETAAVFHLYHYTPFASAARRKVCKVCPLFMRPAFLSYRTRAALGLFLGNGELTKLLQLRFLKEEYRDLSGTVEGLGELKNTRIREAYQKEINRQIAEIAASCTGKEASARITFSADGYTPESAEIRLSASESSQSFPAGAIFSDTPSAAAKTDDSKLSFAAATIRQELFSVYALPSEAVLIFDTGGASL